MKTISNKEILFLVTALLAMLLVARIGSAQTMTYPQGSVDKSGVMAQPSSLATQQLKLVQAQIAQLPLQVSCAKIFNTRLGQSSDVFSFGFNAWTKAGAFASWTTFQDFGSMGTYDGGVKTKVSSAVPLVTLPQSNLEVKPPFVHVSFQSAGQSLDLTLKLLRAPKKGEFVDAQPVKQVLNGHDSASTFLEQCSVKMFW